MKKYIFCLLSTTIMSVQAANIEQPVAFMHNVAYSAKSGAMVDKGGVTLQYYSNRLVKAPYYNKAVLSQILALSQKMGWDSVYIQDLPVGLRGYAQNYFSDNNVDLNRLSDDAIVGPDYRSSDPDIDDTPDVYVEPDDNIPDFFYGYGGSGFYPGYIYPNYNDRHYYHRHHEGEDNWQGDRPHGDGRYGADRRGGDWVGGGNWVGGGRDRGNGGGGNWGGGGGHFGGGGHGGGHGGRR